MIAPPLVKQVNILNNLGYLVLPKKQENGNYRFNIWKFDKFWFVWKFGQDEYKNQQIAQNEIYKKLYIVLRKDLFSN